MTRRRQGIYIPAEVAELEALPDELNADIVEEYRFPDPRRRRTSGWIYLGLTAAFTYSAISGEPGWWWGVGLGLLATGWHFLAAWPLRVEQEEALEIAGKQVGFAVGHASAAIGFTGWRSRPQWQVIVYSAESPPARRALVQLDAVTGEPVAEVYTETL